MSTSREMVLAYLAARPGSQFTSAELAAAVYRCAVGLRKVLAAMNADGEISRQWRTSPKRRGGDCWAYSSRTLRPACPHCRHPL